MSTEMFVKIIDQAVSMNFTGIVNLQHFNEPLFDKRLDFLGHYAKEQYQFDKVMVHTNGDALNEKIASKLDGNFDIINIALYDNNTETRRLEIYSWFSKTRINFVSPVHLITHFSPFHGLKFAIERNKNAPCITKSQYRMIIDYTGEMHMCCDDISKEFDLGNINDSTLEELWYSERHSQIIRDLEEPGGRLKYDYCSICPRDK